MAASIRDLVSKLDDFLFRIEAEVLGTTTARALLFSALTTITSFGSLVRSFHLGLAGLGTLLSLGMSLTAVGNLVLLPPPIGQTFAKFARRVKI